MSSTRRGAGLPAALRAALRLYPAAWRRRYGAQLEADLAAYIAAARGRPGAERVWRQIRLAVDVALGAALQQAYRGRGRGGGTRRRVAGVLDGLVADVRFAVRSLVRQRAFSAAVVLMLGAGIGGVTAMWSVVHDVVLRPLPYAGADRMVRLWTHLAGRTPYFAISPAQYLSWRENGRTLIALAAIGMTTRTVEGGEHAARIPTAFVTANFFEVLGSRPLLGRGFLPGEDLPGAEPVAIVGYGMWQSEFGGSRDIVGRIIRVNGVAREIVGVAAPDLQWLEKPMLAGPGLPGERAAQLWLPRELSRQELGSTLQVVGRVREGASLDAVRAELGVLTESLYIESFGDTAWTDPAQRVTAEWLPDALYGGVRARLILPLAAIGLVLVLACANVANLLLGRLPGRRAELALRAALGAGGVRLARQLLVEMLVLGVVAAALASLIAYGAVRAIAHIGPAEIPRLQQVSLDPRAHAVALGLAAVCTLACGLAPALRGSRADVTRDLNGARRGSAAGAGRSRLVLLAGQLAIACVVLVGAQLLLHSFVRLASIETGYGERDIVMATVHVPADGYQATLGPLRTGGTGVQLRPEWLAFVSGTLDRVRSDPRVESAAIATYRPLRGGEGALVDPIGPAREVRTEPPGLAANYVTTGYFETLGIPLLRGRTFTAADMRLTEPLPAVITEGVARHYWPGEEPIGVRFLGHGSAYRGDSIADIRVLMEVIGVVADARQVYTEPAEPAVYTPIHTQLRERGSWNPKLQFNIIARTQADAGALAPALRAIVAELDERVPVSDVQTLESLTERDLRGHRFQTLIMMLFGAFALALAGSGVFSVLALGTSSRAHEIGVRMALGARARSVIALIVRQTVAAAVVGIGIGLFAAMQLSRFLRSQLFEVRPTDLRAYAAALILLLISAVAAAWIPARRATRIDPARALRAD